MRLSDMTSIRQQSDVSITLEEELELQSSSHIIPISGMVSICQQNGESISPTEVLELQSSSYLIPISETTSICQQNDESISPTEELELQSSSYLIPISETTSICQQNDESISPAEELELQSSSYLIPISDTTSICQQNEELELQSSTDVIPINAMTSNRHRNDESISPTEELELQSSTHILLVYSSTNICFTQNATLPLSVKKSYGESLTSLDISSEIDQSSSFSSNSVGSLSDDSSQCDDDVPAVITAFTAMKKKQSEAYKKEEEMNKILLEKQEIFNEESRCISAVLKTPSYEHIAENEELVVDNSTQAVENVEVATLQGHDCNQVDEIEVLPTSPAQHLKVVTEKQPLYTDEELMELEEEILREYGENLLPKQCVLGNLLTEDQLDTSNQMSN